MTKARRKLEANSWITLDRRSLDQHALQNCDPRGANARGGGPRLNAANISFLSSTTSGNSILMYDDDAFMWQACARPSDSAG